MSGDGNAGGNDERSVGGFVEMVCYSESKSNCRKRWIRATTRRAKLNLSEKL